MKKLFFLLLLLSGSFGAFSQAQTQRRACGAVLVQQQMAQRFPQAYSEYHKRLLNEGAASAPAAGTARKTTATPTIPVVFHVVLTPSQHARLGGDAGIRQRVLSQMEVLNQDYQRMNADTTQVYAPFKPLIGNPDIRFGLAARKPNGDATVGYEIKILNNGADTTFDVVNGNQGSKFACSDAKYATNKGLAAWDVNQYLNIWVVRMTDAGFEAVYGITTSPAFMAGSGFEAETGIVLTYGAFGKRAAFGDYYLLSATGGRTLTHEMGHFFDLEHIWGDDNGKCPGQFGYHDDGISDTPPQAEENYGCPAAPHLSCNGQPNGDMFMNYMDYVDDDCMHMFSQVQSDSLHTRALASSLSQNPWLLSVGNVGTSAQDFSLLPNPATSNLNIAFGKGLPNSVRIMNSNGALAWSGTVKNAALSIDVSTLPRGVYFVQCIFADGTIVKKVVLQ